MNLVIFYHCFFRYISASFSPLLIEESLYIHTHTHTYIYIHTHAYAHTHIYVYTLEFWNCTTDNWGLLFSLSVVSDSVIPWTVARQASLSFTPRVCSNPCPLSWWCHPVISSCQSVSLVAQLCLTLCNPIDCSTPGLHVHHQLLEFTQTHVHCVSDAIWPSHPLSSPSPPALNLSQH